MVGERQRWYPDPEDPSRIRFFDGADWTEHTRPRPDDFVVPRDEARPEPPIPYRRSPRRFFIAVGLVLFVAGGWQLLAGTHYPTVALSPDASRTVPSAVGRPYALGDYWGLTVGPTWDDPSSGFRFPLSPTGRGWNITGDTATVYVQSRDAYAAPSLRSLVVRARNQLYGLEHIIAAGLVTLNGTQFGFVDSELARNPTTRERLYIMPTTTGWITVNIRVPIDRFDAEVDAVEPFIATLHSLRP